MRTLRPGAGDRYPEAVRTSIRLRLDGIRRLDIGYRYSENSTEGTDIMGAWVIGHNLAGYLPESDTFAYETREEAVSAFATLAEEYASEDDDHGNDVIMEEYDSEDDVPDDEWPTMRATVDAILKDDGPDVPDLAGKDYGMHVADSRDRLIYFWMQWEETREPGTDDVGTPLD